MRILQFIHDGWLKTQIEDPSARATMVSLRVVFDGIEIARNVSKRSGSPRDFVNVPLQPIAQALAEHWWQWLYEPYRPLDPDAFKARHRFDSVTNGYAFPAVSVCSGGASSLLVAWRPEPSDSYAIEFITPESPVQVAERASTEEQLMQIVEEALARLKGESDAYSELRAAWNRVSESLQDPDELAYCRFAGRLGLDPYDPDVPDLTEFTNALSPTLLDDISDSANIEDLSETVAWVDKEQPRLKNAPTIDISGFGCPPDDSLDKPPYETGMDAARQLRQRYGVEHKRPHDSVAELFGGALSPTRSALWQSGPASIRGLVQRNGDDARIGAIARTARERHMSVCTAGYMAWISNGEDTRATTRGYTREQMAARAFAREMLAPQDYLKAQAPSRGFTSDDIEELAGQLMCPSDIVAWQASNAGIPLWNVPLEPASLAIV
ncbi:MAG TPA: hypothetical protein VMF11_13585 [Candidatus Baltobacteraceae bacterium]|nr:hypothetical protein [Candidatus Baltobacteraceae bacterium]